MTKLTENGTAGSIDWQKWLAPGDHIVCSHMTSEPCALIESLAKTELDIPLSLDLGVPFTLAARELAPTISLCAMGAMGSLRQLAKARDLAIDSTGYRDAVAAYANQTRRADVVLVSLAQGADGQLCLGASHGAALDAAAHARVVIAEINAGAPAVAGAPWPQAIMPAVNILADYSLAHAAESVPNARDLNIAQRMAELIPDGACLQVGIGSMASALLGALTEHRHLGVHSGMFTDALFRLVQAGAIDHSNKPSGWRHANVGSVYGSQALYDFAGADLSVQLTHTNETHGPDRLAAISSFTAINSALEVDLLGRVNSESAPSPKGGRVLLGGVGGLPDFVNGGLLSPGGRSIIALTARTGVDAAGHSRIVARLEHEITLNESQADIVITEHGVAQLRGLSRRERIVQMLQVADPADRDRLSHEAVSLALAG